MASAVEWVYRRAPVPLQNLMISFQGYRWARKRYTPDFHRYVASLMQSQWYSADEFRELQTRELRSLLREVLDNSAYYRETLGHLGNAAERFELSELGSLPFVEKGVIRARTEEFFCQNRVHRDHAEGHTSGTTGSPMIWPYDWDSFRRNAAFRARQYRWMGVTGKEVSARFTGRLLMRVGKPRPPYWRHNRAENQWLLSCFHLSEDALPHYYDALRRIQPAYFDGIVSAIYVLARWINENVPRSEVRPWAIMTTAETLTDYQRAEMERAFGCRVFDQYSSSEGAPWITQCEVGGRHINPESGIVEFLRPDGTPCEPGEEGEMVVTSFFQRTLPLIRYRIGDRGVPAVGECPCRRKMPLIEQIVGRELDMLYSRERGSVGSSTITTVLFKLHGKVKQSQIEQQDVDRFVVRYVPSKGELSPADVDLFIREFRVRMGDDVQVTLESVSAIPAGPGGKVRTVIGLPPEKRVRREAEPASSR